MNLAYAESFCHATRSSTSDGATAKPSYEPQRNRIKVAEEMDYEAAVGDSVISEQDEVDIPPETNELSEDGAEITENVMLDADVMVKETTE